MTAWDGSGMERAPFDGRHAPLTTRHRRRPTPGHGPTCRPSNPEVGCECGEDERQALRAEMRELREALDTAPSERDAGQAAAVAYYLAHGGAR